MKTIVIMGDPQSLSSSLSELHKNNPKMKVVALAVAPYFVNPSQLAGKISLPPGQAQAIPVHVLYVTYDGVTDLVDEKRNILNWN